MWVPEVMLQTTGRDRARRMNCWGPQGFFLVHLAHPPPSIKKQRNPSRPTLLRHRTQRACLLPPQALSSSQAALSFKSCSDKLSLGEIQSLLSEVKRTMPTSQAGRGMLSCWPGSERQRASKTTWPLVLGACWPNKSWAFCFSCLQGRLCPP